jgi:hypothetical protein
MLHYLRGECYVFNSDAPSGVVSTQAGLTIAAHSYSSWGHGFCLWNAAFAKQSAGEEVAAISYLTEILASSMLAIARVAIKQGDQATATPLLKGALPLAQAMRDRAITSEIEALLR